MFDTAETAESLDTSSQVNENTFISISMTFRTRDQTRSPVVGTVTVTLAAVVSEK